MSLSTEQKSELFNSAIKELSSKNSRLADILRSLNYWFQSGRDPNLEEISAGYINELAAAVKPNKSLSSHVRYASDIMVATFYKSLTNNQKNEVEKNLPQFNSFLSIEYLPKDSATYQVAIDVEHRRKLRKKLEWDALED
jgi:hypothetical protein